MSSNYEFAESLGAHHPGEVSLTVAQAEARERNGIPLPISGDAESDHARELLAIGRARLVGETNPNLTPAQRRAMKVADDVELVNARAKKRQAMYDANQDNVRTVNDIRLTVGEAMDNENDGYPTPVGGDRKVTLRQAIDRGAVTITKGLPDAVLWRRSNPSIGNTMPFKVKLGNPDLPWSAPDQSRPMTAFMWPSPSHEALTDSITALAGVQRRLMIGGRLRVRS